MNTTTLPAPTATSHEFYLCDYERNGHEDSDFFVVFWDDQTGTIRQEEYASTRYARSPSGEARFASFRRDITDEIRAKVRAYIRATALAVLTAADKATVEEPGPANLPFGTAVHFIAPPGPRSKDKWEVGQTGDVTWAGNFGTFYRKGYNHPNRSNGRLGVRLPDGRRVFCPMKAVRLAREVAVAEIEQAAERAGREMDIGGCVPGWTWASAVNPSL